MAGIFIVDDLPALSELVDLSSRPLEEPEWLGERLSEIRRVVICDCRLRDWPGLLFPEAAYLNVSFNQLSDARFLSTFRKLIHVDISHNQITHLDALASLTQVETLKLQNNRVDSLRPLLHLVLLKELNAEYNRLPWTEFQIISHFRQLKILNTSHNRSCDAQEFFPSFIFLNCPSLVFFNGNVVQAVDIDDQRATSIKETYDKAVLDISHPRVTSRSVSEAELVPQERGGRFGVKRSSSEAAVARHREARSLVSKRLAEAVSRGYERFPVIPSNEFSEVIRYGRGDHAPIAMGISADGYGFVRWSSKALTRAIEYEDNRLLANYRNGTVAMDVVEGAGRVFDERGRVLLRLDPRSAYIVDQLTNDTLQTFICGENADESFSYEHGDLSIRFDTKPWVLEVIVRTDVAEVSCSSKSGLHVIRKMEHRRKRKQKSSLAPSFSELENVRLGAQSVISDLAELDALLKNLTFGNDRNK